MREQPLLRGPVPEANGGLHDGTLPADNGPVGLNIARFNAFIVCAILARGRVNRVRGFEDSRFEDSGFEDNGREDNNRGVKG